MRSKPEAYAVASPRNDVTILGNLIRSVSLPYYRHHRGRAAVLVITVALGVSSVVATGALVASGLAAAGRSWGPAAEFADLRIANGFAGVPETLIEKARTVPGVAGAEAVLMARMRAPSRPQPVDLIMIGIDLLESDGVHDAVLPRQAIVDGDALEFLTDLGAVALPKALAAAMGLELGSSFLVELQGKKIELRVAALFEPDPDSPRDLAHVAVADLPALQRLLDRDGLVDAIYVRVENDWGIPDVRSRLSAVVADSATVVPTEGDDPELEGLLFNIRLVLDVAGMVAFIVGALVIYNAVALTVSQRKPVLDVVRSLGTTRRHLMTLLTLESLALGVVGCFIGILLGILQARVTSSLFREALSSLYTPFVDSAFVVSPSYVTLAIILGLGIPWVATLQPARAAARISSGLDVVSPRSERRGVALRSAWLGAFLLGLGLALPMVRWEIPEARRLAAVVTAGDVLVLLGLGFVLPFILVVAAPLVDRTLRLTRLSTIRLSSLAFVADPGRTAAVVASIMIATSNVVVSLAVVSSIRTGVLDWIGTEQQADLLVTPPGSGVLVPAAPLIAAEVGDAIARLDGVAQVDPIRLVAQPFRDRWVVIAARDPDVLAARRAFSVISGDLAATAHRMGKQNIVVASEHFASKYALSIGDRFSLRTPEGAVEFELGAIVVDYSGDLGTVFVARSTFEHYWHDRGVNAYQVWLEPGVAIASARERLASVLSGVCDCLVLSSHQYNARGAEFVDSIFYSAYAIEGVAAVVLLVAITSFFTITLAERRREIALLQIVGASRLQLHGIFLGEALLIALLGGALGCGVGALLAKRIVQGAVRIGGGMVLPFRLPTEAVAVTLGVVVVVALLAALAPIAGAIRLERVDGHKDFDA